MLAHYTPRKAPPFLACRAFGYDPASDSLQYGWYQTGSANEGARRAAPGLAAAAVTWGMSGAASSIAGAVNSSAGLAANAALGVGVGNATVAIAANAVQQGVAVGLGQQEDFDWRSTVAAGVTAYLGTQWGSPDFSTGATWGKFGEAFGRNVALGTVSSVISGDSFSSGSTFRNIALSAASSTASQWASGQSQQAQRAQQAAQVQQVALAGMDHEYGIWGQPQTVANSYPVTSGPVESRALPPTMMGAQPPAFGTIFDDSDYDSTWREKAVKNWGSGDGPLHPDDLPQGPSFTRGMSQVDALNQQAKAKSAGITNAARSVTTGTGGTTGPYDDMQRFLANSSARGLKGASGVDLIPRTGGYYAAPASTTTAEELRGQQIQQINRAFERARASNDVGEMRRLSASYQNITGGDPSSAMNVVQMTSATTRATLDARQQPDYDLFAPAAAAAMGAGGVGGMQPSGAKGAAPTVGGGAKLENLSPLEIARIQNAANRTRVEISVVGSRANGTSHAMSDWDYVVPVGTKSSTTHSLKTSLPEGPRGLGDPRNQDFFKATVDANKPFITFKPQGSP